MRTIYEARMDGSESILYQPISLISYYLECAKDYKDQLDRDEEPELSQTIVLIMFSTMTLESFINELAEFHIEPEDRESFDRCQKPYNKPKGLKQSSVTFKFKLLVEKKYKRFLPNELCDEIEYLIDLRNTLVHYKTSETAGQYRMTPPIKTTTSTGAQMVTLDFTKPITSYIPPFLQKVSVEAGIKAYSIAYHCLKIWFEFDNNTPELAKLEKYKP
jgi:uncharacterized protein YutE (UPF0331/DUF86 family)